MDELRPSVEDAATARFTTLVLELQAMAHGETEIFDAQFDRRIAAASLGDFGVNLDTIKALVSRLATTTNPDVNADGERPVNRVLAELAAGLAAVDRHLVEFVKATIKEIEEFLNAEAEAAGTEESK
ncbi:MULTISPECIES: hypothetical protein [unclassified Frankia]